MVKKVEHPQGSVNPPAYGSVAFSFDSVKDGAEAFSKYGIRYAYGRMGNPSIQPFEEWFAEFEGADKGSVWATNTGMSAISLLVLGATLGDLGKGKKIVSSRYLYGGTYHLLETLSRNGHIDVVWVENPFDLASWDEACLKEPKPAFVFLETPANPTIDIFDIAALAGLAHKRGSRLVVDNTLGVGLQQPICLGADATVYSITKAVNRKSSELGGALVLSRHFRKEVEDVFDDLFVHMGIVMHPGSALAAYNNRTTLKRDMRHFSENALKVAEFLENHSKVKKVNYPALRSSVHHNLCQSQMGGLAGGILSFELKSFEDAVKFVELQKEAYLAVHLGDGNSHFLTHPASTTHSKLSVEELDRLNITSGLVRMSVSLGDEDNISLLIDDFSKALDRL